MECRRFVEFEGAVRKQLGSGERVVEAAPSAPIAAHSYRSGSMWADFNAQASFRHRVLLVDSSSSF